MYRSRGSLCEAACTDLWRCIVGFKCSKSCIVGHSSLQKRVAAPAKRVPRAGDSRASKQVHKLTHILPAHTARPRPPSSTTTNAPPVKCRHGRHTSVLHSHAAHDQQTLCGTITNRTPQRTRRISNNTTAATHTVNPARCSITQTHTHHNAKMLQGRICCTCRSVSKV